MVRQAHFDDKLFKFLRDLKKHNDKAWFAANKSRYEQHVKQPLLSFIGDFAVPLAGISTNYVADPRPVGGSMFRIYRDVRFSKEKTPYKTAATAQFRHRAGKDVHSPGFYLHLEPGNVFVGVGLWRPEPLALTRIRATIIESPDAWKKAAYAKAFRTTFDSSGEALKRPPPGVAADHPFVDDLKRKDFVAMAALSEEAACSPDFLHDIVKRFKTASSFMRFLTESVGLPW